jgi:hypothetical protein
MPPLSWGMIPGASARKKPRRGAPSRQAGACPIQPRDRLGRVREREMDQALGFVLLAAGIALLWLEPSAEQAARARDI